MQGVCVNLDEKIPYFAVEKCSTVPNEFDARVVGKCEQADLALLKIDAEGLPTVSVGGPGTARPVRERVVSGGGQSKRGSKIQFNGGFSR